MTGKTAHPTLASADLDDISKLPRNAWCAALDDTAEELGYFEQLGRDHACAFIEGNDTLLVSFDNFERSTKTSANGYPEAFNLALDNGWSHLSILAHNGPAAAKWFRSPAVYDYFDRLVDDGFFEEYDRVVFYGAGPNGYAACAYSVTAPGATVIALAPQATLDSRLTSWDNRFPSTRRADFTSRYGFAPHMIEGAQAALVLYDPYQTEDAMHAALFNAPHVTRRPVPHFGADIETSLVDMDILEPLLIHAMEGTLTPAVLTRLLRARRHNMPYLRRLLREVEAHGNPHRVVTLCRAVTARVPTARRFRMALKAAQRAIGSQSDKTTPKSADQTETA
ncbi:phosphoadenosine phosphosulfate reductase [Celeribacter sp.]|uniref:phosphoadenosine phosphosulfate reductase n=1 Tax=Celeribacter sp. TaxID=1890673 RepID=UPI003A8F4A94